MKIRFCENNKGKKKVINKLEEKYPEVEMEITKCLGKCGACSEAYLAEVDGRVIVCKDTENLYKNIVKIMEEG
jgi:uncharacterized protein YuzB (UPF0349 family)